MSVPRERMRRAPYSIPAQETNNHDLIVEIQHSDRAPRIAGAFGFSDSQRGLPDTRRFAPVILLVSARPVWQGCTL